MKKPNYNDMRRESVVNFRGAYLYLLFYRYFEYYFLYPLRGAELARTVNVARREVGESSFIGRKREL